jgi:hypothetical protein
MRLLNKPEHRAWWCSIELGELAKIDRCRATVCRGDTPHDAQPLRVADRATWPSTLLLLCQGGIDGRSGLKHQLQTLQRDALTGMQQPKGPNAMKPSRLYVLQESAKKLVRQQCHQLFLVVFAVAITECHGSLGALYNRAI